jgi:molybdate transport system substrate-binding protein
MRFRFLTALLVCLVATIARAGDHLTISAAVSLKDPIAQIVKQFEHDTGTPVDLNLGASGQLAAQIDAGAPVDVFISAGESPIQQLEKSDKIRGTRIIAGNHVVLIVPAGRSDISDFQSLTKDSVKRLAIGKPKVVPAGDYAMQVLTHLGIVDAVKDKFVYGQNVRQVLDYVARGEVDAGIVYTTDAADAKDQVRVVATAEESTHDPVRYLAAVVKSGKADPADKFVIFLTTPAAQDALRSAGFLITPTPAGK